MGQDGEGVGRKSGAELRKFEGHTDGVTSVSFSGDGKQVVSGSWDKTVRVWTWRGAELRKFEGHTDRVCPVVLGDGKQVVSGSDDKTVRVWTWRAARAEKVRGAHHYVSPCRFRATASRW